MPITTGTPPEKPVDKRRVVVLYTLLLGLLWGFLLYWEARAYRHIMQSSRQSIAQAASSLAKQTNGMLKELEAGLTAAEHWLSCNPSPLPWRDPEFIRLVEELRGISGGLIDIRIVSREGRLYHVPPREGDGMDVTDREYVRIHQAGDRRGLYVATPVLSRLTGKWSIPVALGVAEQASRAAVVSGVLVLDDFMALSEPYRPEHGGMLGLVRDDGTLLAHWPVVSGMLGANVGQTREFARFSRDGRGVAVIHDGICGPGTWSVGFSRLSDYPVTVFLSSPTSWTLRPWRVEVSVFVLLSVCVSIVTTGVVFRLCRVMDDNLHVQRELRVLATYDHLTGLYNRQAFLAQANREAALAKRGSRPFCVVVVDVDGFKMINDTHGHHAGDEVLRRLGGLFRLVCREADLAGRLGGEEFAVLLADTALADAVTVAERLRCRCREMDLRFETGPAPVTVSAGVVEYDFTDGVIDHTLQRADIYLYAAKHNGRNRVESPLSFSA